MGTRTKRRSARARRRGLTLLVAGTAVAMSLALSTSATAMPSGLGAWGRNGVGELGIGSFSPNTCQVGAQTFEGCSLTPAAVHELTGVTAASVGGAFSLALLANGTVMAWGLNESGQLGNGTTANSNIPVPVSGLTGVMAISAGEYDSLALLENGTVMAWGQNLSRTPVAVSGLSDVTAISSGWSHSLALQSDGTVMAWGANRVGQLGNGTMGGGSNVPVAVTGLSGVTAISAGDEDSHALLSDGHVEGWGLNDYGQIGDGTTENTDVPVAVSGLSEVTEISAGGSYSLALQRNGTVKAWGENYAGELGDGTKENSDVPVAVSGLDEVTAVSGGGGALALVSDHTVRAWGGNLGNGSSSSTTSDVPVEVSLLRGVLGIASGSYVSLAYGPFPTVTGVTPNAGPTAGEATVSITGVALNGATAVKFGAANATSFIVNSSTSITAVSPAAAAGTADVTVTVPEATSLIAQADEYTFVSRPSVAKVKPSKGPASGSTTVTIAGSNLAGATAVRFGAASASSFEEKTVKGVTSLIAVSPESPAGKMDVTVTTAGGTSPLVAKDHFEFVPTVTDVSPNSGSKGGGTNVTVRGAGFAFGTSATVFKFGTTKAKSVSCSSSTECAVVAPAHAAGTVDVKATVNKAVSVKDAPSDQFTYE